MYGKALVALDAGRSTHGEMPETVFGHAAREIHLADRPVLVVR